MSRTTDLLVITVSFNVKDLLHACLRSVEQAKGDLDVIVVVDNASADGSVELVRREFPHAELIALSENLGFAAANNKAIRKYAARYYLLLNPDTVVQPNTLQTMVKYMDEHPDVGVATCRVNLANGSIDPACHRGFPTPWASFTYFTGLERLFPKRRLFGQYHLTYLPLDTVHEIDSPSGAFYLVRKSVLDQVGALDERFFMYAEELDLSLRIKRAGWKVMYVPTTSIVHYKGQTGIKSNDTAIRARASRAFWETMLQFYDKHYRSQYPRVVSLLVWLGIKVKLILG